MFSTTVIQNIIIGVLVFVFSLTLWFGYRAGRDIAQGEAIVRIASQTTEGLQYFFSDQDRYPTTFEFNDKTVMLSYFNKFPPSQLPSKKCVESFRYENSDSQHFRLPVCLPRGFESYQKGWN